jgi:Ca-activated chloride channel family protein
LADVKTIASDPVAGLIDIPLPHPMSLWPQTWPAQIAIGVLLTAAVVALGQLARHRRANRYRREALAELTRIAHTSADMGSRQIAAQLALLLRRTALAAFPREQIAPLAGDTWLAFLDRTGDSTEFSQGCGRWFASAAYAPTPPGESQLAALVDLTRRWIRGHHA